MEKSSQFSVSFIWALCIQLGMWVFMRSVLWHMLMHRCAEVSQYHSEIMKQNTRALGDGLSNFLDKTALWK